MLRCVLRDNIRQKISFRICSTDLYVNGRIGKNITYLLPCEYRVLCSPAPTILCCELSCCVTGCMAISGHVPRGHDARSKDVPSRGIRYYCRVNCFHVIKLFDSLGKRWFCCCCCCFFFFLPALSFFFPLRRAVGCFAFSLPSALTFIGEVKGLILFLVNWSSSQNIILLKRLWAFVHSHLISTVF